MKNTPFFPVAKSFLSEAALANAVEAAYNLSGVRCQLIAAFMRDVYLVTTRQEHYVLFIYRHNHRTLDEIKAEWQIVDYLKVHNVPVAPAITTQSGDTVLSFPAPEGVRYGVLSTFVAGKHLRQRPSLNAVQAYGRHIARIHLLADEMPFSLSRPVNDVAGIGNGSIAAFAAEAPERPDDLDYLHRCAAVLLPRIAALPQETPLYGLIHGDVIRANAQVGDDGSITVLDFDLCGPGWRAYDIASYLSAIRGQPDEAETEKAFLSGYEQIRPVSEPERELLPVFEAIRHIFAIGVPAMNVYHWGSAYLHAFLDQSLTQLRNSMAHVR